MICSDHDNYIKTTGEWWIEPWWEEPGHYDGINYSLNEINSAIEHVKKLFNGKWFLENQININDEEKFWNSKPHPFMINLKAKGIIFLLPLVSLGLDLESVSKHKHLIGNLYSRLKRKDEFHGARFELSLLAHLIRQGFNIKRDPKIPGSNKNCDFKIQHNDETIYLELKSLFVSEANREREYLFMKLGTDLMSRIRSHPFDFNFTNEYRNFLHTKEGLDYLQNNYTELFDKIASHIKSSADKNELGEHHIEGIGTYLIDPPGSRQGYDIDLKYRSPLEEVKKFISNAIKEAKEQLIESGILLIKYPYVVNENVCIPILQFFVDNGAAYKNISQVIIVYETMEHSTFSEIKNKIRIIVNPHAINISETEIIKSIIRAYHSS